VQGPNRYEYVGGNPETRTDPSGNCFIVCAAIGAAVGFVGDLAVQEVSSIANGQGFTTNLDWGQAATWAVAGAVIGGTGGLALAGVASLGLTGVGATVVDGAATGGLFGSVSSLVGGVVNGEKGDRLAHDTIIGGITGAISGAFTSWLGTLPTPSAAMAKFLGVSAPNLGWVSAGRIVVSSLSQGFISGGGALINDLWNGDPINSQAIQQAGFTGLVTAVASLPGSIVGQALIGGGSDAGQPLFSWGARVGAAFDGTVQGAAYTVGQSAWSFFRQHVQ
jgi:hypothetical protein